MDFTNRNMVLKSYFIVFLMWGCQLPYVYTARILGFFPMPTRSHQRFMQPLLKELSLRGHSVVLYTPSLVLQDYPPNLEIVEIPDYMPIMKQIIKADAANTATVFTGDDGLRTVMNIIWYRKFGNDLAEWMFQQDEVQQLLTSNREFDVIFLSATYFQEPFVTLGHRFNASIITFLPSNNWLWAHYVHGNPYDTSYIGHKNMAVFITHGGLLSLTEALDSGVPTIGVPLASDQMKNVRHMEHFGYGLRLHINNLTAKSLSWAIQEIINKPLYRKNAKKRSQLFRDKPDTALETAVYWTEYVIRHKGAHHLRPAIATMPWYQQAMIDVYATIAVVLLLVIYLFYWILTSLIRLCRSSKH